MKRVNMARFSATFVLVLYFMMSGLLISFIAGITSPVFGQEIRAKVTTTLEKLPQNKRDELHDFAQKLEQYIDSHEWTRGEYPYSLECQVGVFLEEVRTSYEDRYSGRFYINTEMGVQYVDRYWDFAYNRGDQLSHVQADFSPLLGLVDYYIYRILGEEMDRLGAFRGTPYFEKALDLANQGKFCRMPRWWDERYKEMQFILSDTHKPFRNMTHILENILFYMDEGNPAEAKKMSKDLLQHLQQISAEERERQYLEKFFNQNNKELANIAIFQDDDSLLQTLIQLDPQRAEYYKTHK